MGKHSLPESPGFWRSVVIAVAKYALVAAVIAGVGFGIYQLVSNDEPNQPAEPVESLPPLPTDEPELEFSPLPEETTSPSGTPSPGGTPSPSPTASPTGSPPAAGGRRVQVLDGADSGTRAARAVQQIQNAGYEVVATGRTSRPYERTTVFYQPGNEQTARDLASLIGAADVLVAPANLDSTVPLAIVVGPDYAG